MNINNILEYISRHKGAKVFRGFNSLDDLKYTIQEAINRNNFLVAVDTSNTILGVALFRTSHWHNKVFIQEVLCTHREGMRILLAKFIQLYGARQFEAVRRGKYKIYNTNILCNKILSKTLH